MVRHKEYLDRTSEQTEEHLEKYFNSTPARTSEEAIDILKAQFGSDQDLNFSNRLMTSAATAGIYFATHAVFGVGVNLEDISHRTGINFPSGDMVSCAGMLAAAQALMKLCEEMHGESSTGLPRGEVSKSAMKIIELAGEVGPGVYNAVKAKYLAEDGTTPEGTVINVMEDGSVAMVTKPEVKH